MKQIIKIAGLKDYIRKKGFKIGNKNLKKISSLLDSEIHQNIKKIVHKAMISGRKTIKPSDFFDEI